MHGGITVLVENTVWTRGLYAEHGLSMLIEVEGRVVLFDTGQTDLIFHNARVLGADLERVESIVLSHGHYDHTGGLLPLLEALPTKPVVFAHPDVFLKRYGRYEAEVRPLDPPYSKDEMERAGATLKLSEGPQEVFPGVVTTGEVPRLTDFEDVGGPYYLDRECKRPDVVQDDVSLVIDAPDGLIICCGCAHSGVVNILQHVRGLFPGKSVDTVIGGLHLGRASDERLDSTISALREMKVRGVFGGHCTGPSAAARMAREIPDVFKPLYVGARHEFGG